jgi:hypothetical protein
MSVCTSVPTPPLRSNLLDLFAFLCFRLALAESGARTLQIELDGVVEEREEAVVREALVVAALKEREEEVATLRQENAELMKHQHSLQSTLAANHEDNVRLSGELSECEEKLANALARGVTLESALNAKSDECLEQGSKLEEAYKGIVVIAQAYETIAGEENRGAPEGAAAFSSPAAVPFRSPDLLALAPPAGGRGSRQRVERRRKGGRSARVGVPLVSQMAR